MRETCVVAEVGEHILENGRGKVMGTSHKSEVVFLVPTKIFESSSKKLRIYVDPCTPLADESVEYEAPCSRPISGDLSVGLKRCVAHFCSSASEGRGRGKGVGKEGWERVWEGGVILKYHSFSQYCVNSFLRPALQNSEIAGSTILPGIISDVCQNSGNA